MDKILEIKKSKNEMSEKIVQMINEFEEKYPIQINKMEIIRCQKKSSLGRIVSQYVELNIQTSI